MKARDIMTSSVISVGVETRTQDIARLMLANHISAVPVIDATGSPVGMVSEGDLIGRNETDREARHEWWLALLAEGEQLSPEFLSSVHRPERTARDVMAKPVITVGEGTDVGEIARLLQEHRFKRVPVVRDGQVVGIVSRENLLRALAAEKAQTDTEPAGLVGVLSGLVKHFEPHHKSEAHTTAPISGTDNKHLRGSKCRTTTS